MSLSIILGAEFGGPVCTRRNVRAGSVDCRPSQPDHAGHLGGCWEAPARHYPGRISAFGATAPAAGSSNKGNGTVAVTQASGEKIGAYALVAASDTKFNVTDPSRVLADATVGADYNAGGIAFKISAGTTAFASGDSFTVTVADGVGSFVKSVKTATDGSQEPVAVLVDDVDATAGPRPGSALHGRTRAPSSSIRLGRWITCEPRCPMASI